MLETLLRTREEGEEEAEGVMVIVGICSREREEEDKEATVSLAMVPLSWFSKSRILSKDSNGNWDGFPEPTP